MEEEIMDREVLNVYCDSESCKQRIPYDYEGCGRYACRVCDEIKSVDYRNFLCMVEDALN